MRVDNNNIHGWGLPINIFVPAWLVLPFFSSRVLCRFSPGTSMPHGYRQVSCTAPKRTAILQTALPRDEVGYIRGFHRAALPDAKCTRDLTHVNYWQGFGEPPSLLPLLPHPVTCGRGGPSQASTTKQMPPQLQLLVLLDLKLYSKIPTAPPTCALGHQAFSKVPTWESKS